MERPDLIKYLADAEVKLILVAAPPGFGKTTLVAQWRCSPVNRKPFAWVSLDRADNDPVRLWWHVVSSLRLACPAFESEKVLAMLRGQAPDFGGAVLPVLVHEMASLPERVVLVLDDYHLIEKATCHEQVALLLGRLPPRVQVVIATRADPPLPLARMRALGEMVEIRAPELRFDVRQAAELIHAVVAAELSERDLASLVRRTEGWPAGLHLAALSMRRDPAPDAFVRHFSGANRFVVDYLVEDVLNQQPSDIREFLMRTSILGRFCAPLCEAVTGSAGAAAIIDLLERENLFVVPLDEDRRWFRYHHLFAQVLRGQLTTAEPSLAPALHARASAWHQASGSTDEAITHALAAGDFGRATGLIAQHFHAYNDSGRGATVRHWLRKLGDDRIAASPLAAHCAAWTAALSGDLPVVQRCLPVIEAAGDAGPLPDGMRSFASSAAILRTICGFDGLGPMRAAGLRAVALETDPGSRWYAAAHGGLSTALYWAGEFEAAAGHAQEARLNPEAVAPFRLLAAAVLTWLEVEAGRLRRPASWPARPGNSGPTRASASAAPPGVPLPTWPSAPCTRRKGTWARPAANWSTRSRYGGSRRASARGPSWKACSGWCPCWRAWVSARGPPRFSPRPGECSSRCRTARTLSWLGWRPWNGGSEAGPGPSCPASRSPNVNGMCWGCSRARCPCAISAASSTCRPTPSRPIRGRSTGSWTCPTGRTRWPGAANSA